MPNKQIYLLVKAYPEKSKKYGASICTAGLTTEGDWVRVYPIDLGYYFINKGMLKKWNLIEADVKEASEKLKRKESHKINEHSIKLIDDSLTKLSTSKTKKQKIWENRNAVILPHLDKSIEELNIHKSQDHTSLGIIKPKKYQFKIRKRIDEIKVIKSNFVQKTLDGYKIKIPDQIEKIFSYKFSCDDPNCKGHDMICEDWELFEAFRSWKKKYTTPLQ